MICYHGTNADNAKKIMVVGFNPNSWFAKHMEDAVKFGGEYVIAVEVDRKKVPRGWQFHILDAFPRSEIKGLYKVCEY